MLTIEHLYEEFEKYRRTINWVKQPEGLYQPVDYIMSLGGKRMRPLLLLSAYQMFSDDLQKAMPAALGVEVFHNFTLVHDDIMDSAHVRRGKPTVHKTYGVNSAILSGDVMLIKSYDLLLQGCDENNASTCLQLMFDTSREICEGQQFDVDFENRDDVAIDDYLEMIRLKTGVLLSASLQLGAILGGASQELARQLYHAGAWFGTAFQIQDDLLDAYGSPDITGKRRGGDIVHSKKTYLYTSAMEKLPATRRRVFAEMYNQPASNPEVKIQKVLRVLDELDIAKSTTEMIDEQYHRGLEALDKLPVDGVRKMPLLDFVRKLKVRLT